MVMPPQGVVIVKLPKRRQPTIKELDDLLRWALMLRQGAALVMEGKRPRGWWGICQKCGKEKWLTVSHIEPKGTFQHLRHDLRNVVALCGFCHIHWWHKNPREAEQWITALLGKRERDDLARRAVMHAVKPDRFDTKRRLTAVVNDYLTRKAG